MSLPTAEGDSQHVATCGFGEEYLRLNSGSISNTVAEALNLIKTHIYPNASFLQGSPSVAEVSRQFAIVHPQMGPGCRGVYISRTNQIMLTQGLWCVKTPIHETLHSVSSIQRLEEALQLKPLFEGLTECLAGLLLYKKYPEVYSNCWKTNEQRPCHMTYEPTCRLWGAFFHFVPVKTIVPLYLQCPPDWKRMCRLFVELVKEAGYPNFNDVLGDVLSNSAITQEDFRNECRTVFGREFTLFSRSPVAFDFSAVKLS